MIPLGVLAATRRPGAPPAAGLPPNTYAGLTLWYDADGSPMYVGGSTTTGATPPTGGQATRVDSNGGINRTMYGFGPVLVPAAFGAYRGINTEVGAQQLYTRPSGTAEPTAYLAMSSLVSVSNKVLIFAGRINSAPPNSGTPYANFSILGEAGGYFGLYVYQAGGQLTFQAYNYDSTNGERVTTTTAAPGEPVVISLRHSGGVLRIRKNGVQMGTIAAAASSTLSSGAILSGSSGGRGLMINQLVTYNAARTDAEMLEVERWCGARIGVAF